jgi:uncharacterized protein (DUF952 family)
MKIYKILRKDEWQKFRREGVLDGAPVDIQDGYIHFSTAAQVAETAARHFTGEAGLVLLEVDADRLGGALKWEPSRGGQLFPHLYASLPLQLVGLSWPLPLDNGIHKLPPAVEAAALGG